jgi:outer membrane protein OmpA-like peptidoglycan-associated protein
MKNGIQILLLLSFSCLWAQEHDIHTVYFEFDKFTLNQEETNSIIELVNSPAFSKTDTIKLYGYCDDRGSEGYNNVLSNQRAITVQTLLAANGISLKKIFVREGKGRVNLAKKNLENLEIIRYKNRRVDIVYTKKPTLNHFPLKPKVGDLIISERILFEMGSSNLTVRSKNELDRMFIILKKYNSLQFEIRGHVCCTSRKHSDAIDQESLNRTLSINRAKNVFVYLRTKGINPYRMSYKGFGNKFPLGKGDAFDRRVEFLITKL